MNEPFLLDTPNAVIPVSLLVSSARLVLEKNLPLAWISGEISNFSRAGSGHCYFVLKDKEAQVRCVLFRNKAQWLEFDLRDGLQVELRALPTLYEPRGEFQLNVDTLRLAGMGALYEAFAKRKAELAARGWFAAERKRTLPFLPKWIGIITSLAGAVLHDVLSILQSRFPTPIVIYPTPVQGAGAAQQIAAAIRAANQHTLCQTLILCRGGGSIEDLWCFNEEVVACAVYESAIPIISAVGHETDFTICDFVADMRAATPSAAASLVVPDRSELLIRIKANSRQLAQNIQRQLAAPMQRLDYAQRRLRHPIERLREQQAKLTQSAQGLSKAIKIVLERLAWQQNILWTRYSRQLRTAPWQSTTLTQLQKRWSQSGFTLLAQHTQKIDLIEQSLRHLNPLAVLQRGYSIITKNDGSIVQDAQQIRSGESLNACFAQGEARVVVTEIIATPHRDQDSRL